MEPVTVSISDAAKAIGCGRSKIYQMIQSRQLVSVRLGGRRLVRVDSIRALIDSITEVA